MAIKLIGYEEKKGTFTNKTTGEVVAYNNTEIYFLSNEKPTVKGWYADSASAKTDDLKIINGKTIQDALDKEVYLITDVTAKKDEEGKSRLRISKIVIVG